MELSDILELPNEAMWNIIMKELNVDQATFEKVIDDFKVWVKDEPDMPNDVDEGLIRNVVSHSQCDLSIAKQRFQRYLQYRTRHEAYCTNRDDKYFDDLSLYRQVAPIPKYAPGGYRIIYAGFLPNIEEFDFQRLLDFLYFYFDFVLCKEFCSGYIGLYDLQYFKLEHLEKVDLKQFVDVLHLIFNLRLCRIKEIHFINVPPTVPESIRKLLKQLDNAGLAEKTYVHKSPDELKDYIPNDILPTKYGGGGDDLEEVSKNFKKYFVQNKELRRKINSLKYTGPLPQMEYSEYGLNEQ